MKIYQKIAKILQAIKNCEDQEALTGRPHEWTSRHRENLESLIKNRFPSGSGFDAGTTLDDSSTAARLVFNTEFHHMNDAGYYVGWTAHKVIITGDLADGFNMRITGRDRNGIKEYIGDVFHGVLMEEV